MYSELYKKTLFTQPVDVMKTYIYEYDIEKANINMLYHAGEISEEQLEEFYRMPSYVRKVQIGLMIKKDNETNGKGRLQKIIDDGIIESKRRLFEQYDIQDEDILAIRKDAVFLIKRIPDITAFDNIKFTLRNWYSLFLKADRVEFFYRYTEGDEKLDIKNVSEITKISDKAKSILELLQSVLYMYTMVNAKEALIFLRTLYQNYVSRSLEIEYYRSIKTGRFDIMGINGISMPTSADIVSDELVPYINIDANAILLRELSKPLYKEYLKGK